MSEARSRGAKRVARGLYSALIIYSSTLLSCILTCVGDNTTGGDLGLPVAHFGDLGDDNVDLGEVEG